MRQRRAINKKFFSQKQKSEPGFLYKLVFSSGSSRLFVALLFVSFLLQPVSFIYANEETETGVTPLSEAINLEIDPQPLDLLDEEQAAASEVIEEVDIASVEPLETSAISSSTDEAVVPPDSLSEEIPVSDISSTTASTTDTEVATTTDDGIEGKEIPEEVIPDVPEEIEDTASSTETIIATTTATTSETVAEEAVLQVEHNSHEFQFNTEECTSVGDGSFYCSKNDQAPESKPDGVFSAPDKDGDMEIYIRVNNIEQQLTHNSVDDQAPYYDAYSQRIVWHANHQDRYQIMSYDFKDNKEIQLTNENYNNMEPVAFNNITLWQAWINNNWEIVSFDGQTATQLTNNDFHDVSPHMRGDFIIWQSQFAEGWKVTIFDTKTGQIEYLDAEAGTKLENPRFVLVYDSTSESGDIQTLGYDPDKKQSFTLGSLPAEMPEELPEPDKTGETRALIQSKPSTKSVEIEESEPVRPHSSSTPPELDLPTLDLSTSTATSTKEVTTATELPQVTAATSSYSHIPDLVIPPIATSTEA